MFGNRFTAQISQKNMVECEIKEEIQKGQSTNNQTGCKQYLLKSSNINKTYMSQPKKIWLKKSLTRKIHFKKIK